MNRLWYPDSMMRNSRCNRTLTTDTVPGLPGAVATCLTWDDQQDKSVTSRTSRTTTTLTRTVESTVREDSFSDQHHQHHQLIASGTGDGHLYHQRAFMPTEDRADVREVTFRNNPLGDRRHCSTVIRRGQPGDTGETTTWMTMSGHEIEASKVIEAVHNVAPTFDETALGSRIEREGRYGSIPRPPSRSAAEAMSRRSSAKRRVELRHDDQGRPVNLTIIRPNTPQYQQLNRNADNVPSCCHLATDMRRHPSARRPMTCVSNHPPPAISIPHTSAPCCCSRPVGARIPARDCCGIGRVDEGGCTYGGRRHVTSQVTQPPSTSALDDGSEEMRQALLAIYQAGKPDERFHVRAPSSAVLQSMLKAINNQQGLGGSHQVVPRYSRLSDGSIRSTSTAHPGGRCENCAADAAARRRCHGVRRDECSPVCAHCREHLPLPDVINDVIEPRPVKVNVNCSASPGAVVTFRVESTPQITHRVF